MNFSDAVEKCIELAVESYNGNYNSSEALQDLISMGELVDRLSIVNFKLYTLKDKVMESDDDGFKAWASVEDVKLVLERARLKKAIDSKLLYMITTFLEGDESGGFNPEVKRYGNEARS